MAFVEVSTVGLILTIDNLGRWNGYTMIGCVVLVWFHIGAARMIWLASVLPVHPPLYTVYALTLFNPWWTLLHNIIYPSTCIHLHPHTPLIRMCNTRNHTNTPTVRFRGRRTHTWHCTFSILYCIYPYCANGIHCTVYKGLTHLYCVNLLYLHRYSCYIISSSRLLCKAFQGCLQHIAIWHKLHLIDIRIDQCSCKHVACQLWDVDFV